MKVQDKGKFLLRRLVYAAGFRPIHLGQYIRRLHFRSQCRRLPMDRFRRILDAGCGPGLFALEIAQECQFAEVQGVDLHPGPMPEDAPANLSLVRGDLLQLAASEEFDFIYSIDVLEHIRGNQKIMRNFFSALNPGGYLFLHIPDDRREKRILPRRFFREFDQWVKREHVGEQYTPLELSEELSQIGFKVLDARYTFGWLGQIAWELDRLTDGHWRIKVFLMPFMKLLALGSTCIRPQRGSVLVVAQK